MKRVWVLVPVAAVAATLAFWASYKKCVTRDCDEITWLTREFKLSDHQKTEIVRVKTAYEPICSKHCEAINAAVKQVRELEQTGDKSSDAYKAAVAEAKRVHSVCRQATFEHVQAVAAIMDPPEAQRYLRLVLPELGVQAGDSPLGMK